ncbi:cyclase family protein [Salinirubrum litoreum]|uniref:Cyclase family protein n=1 Tax=Salinirubrum litoreum TaxID=1126234 RepID=A0ABD5RD46_9EURY
MQDLSHPIRTGMPTYPGDPAVSLTPHATHESDGYRVTSLSLGSHTGTHVDAPAHVDPGGKTLADYPVERFRFDARLADCRGVGAGEAVEVADLRSAGLETDVADRDLLVVRTGWADHWDTDAYLDHPYLAPGAAAWCAERVLAVALDTPSPDPFGDAALPAHHALLGADCLVIENVTNLSGLPARFAVRALPVLGVDGSPVRVVAEW